VVCRAMACHSHNTGLPFHQQSTMQKVGALLRPHQLPAGCNHVRTGACIVLKYRRYPQLGSQTHGACLDHTVTARLALEALRWNPLDLL
jgi:hypothetical protein